MPTGALLNIGDTLDVKYCQIKPRQFKFLPFHDIKAETIAF